MTRHLVKKDTQKIHGRNTLNKQNLKSNKKSKKQIKQIIGGGIMNLVIHEEKDKSTALPFGLSKYNLSSYFKSTQINPNMYRVMYNYGSPYQIDLTLKQNQVIQSSNVISKPHLFMPDMHHYLISLIEHPGKPNSRLLWLASYKNRSWEHDILSYMPPSPKPGQTRAYALLVYKYPLDISLEQIYKPIEMTTAKRKEEYRNFQIYLAANKMIQAIPGLSKYFKVQYDAGNAISFLSNVLVGKTKSGYGRQNKIAVRQTPPRMEMKEKFEKFEKIE